MQCFERLCEIIFESFADFQVLYRKIDRVESVYAEQELIKRRYIGSFDGKSQFLFLLELTDGTGRYCKFILEHGERLKDVLPGSVSLLVPGFESHPYRLDGMR